MEILSALGMALITMIMSRMLGKPFSRAGHNNLYNIISTISDYNRNKHSMGVTSWSESSSTLQGMHPDDEI